ncbi:MAG: CinA family protein [Oscillospiraceae bacterium]|nr:CinA family protein [Oscillospiraceae bacterium]
MLMRPEEKLVSLLKEKGLVAATAESCTGGLIAKRITDVSGSSSVFNCGIVSYSNEIKHSVLGVSEETLCRYGAVSEQTVREMVLGVLRVSNADIAVAVSGIAGPASDNTDKPVGLIFLAASNGKKTVVKKLQNKFTGDVRRLNRKSASDEALKILLSLAGE